MPEKINPTKIDFSEAWEEENDFTNWLVSEGNLSGLSASLGIELEYLDKFIQVNGYEADIHCRDINTSHDVVIEIEITSSTHKHLGQLITYAAGLRATTCVWVCEELSFGHKAAIDWLNQLSDYSTRFYGVEFNVYKHGEYVFPIYNVEYKPNYWSKSIINKIKELKSDKLNGIPLKQFGYWTFFNWYVGQESNIYTPAMPQGDNYVNLKTIGNFIFTPKVDFGNNKLRVVLAVTKDRDKSMFESLHSNKIEIEKVIPDLVWDKKDGAESEIYIEKSSTDLENNEDRGNQYKWLLDKLEDFHQVFMPYISEIMHE